MKKIEQNFKQTNLNDSKCFVFKQVAECQSLSEAVDLINSKREPFILKNFDLGPCVQKWSVDYLKSVVKDKQVKIHVSSVSDMDFLKKNFIYRTLPFNELISRASQSTHKEFFICENEKYYLRSLGADERKDVADIKQQFPDLANDINIPPLFDDKKFFSSVFRISSNEIRMWTHYDIMDNVLIQVSGHKRVILFPPSDIDFLYMKGDKSQVLDVDEPDSETFPLFAKATRYECELIAGDCLFIPALWLHNVITKSFSIGVNVFWKHLSDEFYEKNDLYGNKDLVNGSKALLFGDKAIKEIDSLPDKTYKEFYTKRLIQNLLQNLNK